MEFRGDFYQIGVVVRDIDAGMAHYRNLLGLGPFWRLDTDMRAVIATGTAALPTGTPSPDGATSIWR